MDPCSSSYSIYGSDYFNLDNIPPVVGLASSSNSSQVENFYDTPGFLEYLFSDEAVRYDESPFETLGYEYTIESDDDSAALTLAGIKSSSRSPIEEEQPAKRPCTVTTRTLLNEADPFSTEGPLQSSNVAPKSLLSSSKVWENETMGTQRFLKDARALLGISMLLRNALPPNVDSMGLTEKDLSDLRYYASIKALCVVTRSNCVVTFKISEIFDKVIYKYINTNKEPLHSQSQSARFRYWSETSGDMLGAVKNKVESNEGNNRVLSRTFTKVNSSENILFCLFKPYSQEALGDLSQQAVSTFLQEVQLTEKELVSQKRSGPRKHYPTKGVRLKFQELIA